MSTVALPLVTSAVMEFFPRGIEHYLLGGLLIGLGTVVIYLGTGVIAGASTFLESSLSYVSKQARFQEERFVSSRDWRVVFTLSIVAGAAVYAVVFQGGFVSGALQPDAATGELRDVAGLTIWVTEVESWRLFLGGILVGVGTRLGKGCTSGHGICGVGSVSSVSIVNVGTFMVVAIGTALVMASVGYGVTP